VLALSCWLLLFDYGPSKRHHAVLPRLLSAQRRHSFVSVVFCGEIQSKPRQHVPKRVPALRGEHKQQRGRGGLLRGGLL